jgi:hypothetical protein
MDIFQNATWPGIVGIENAKYVNSHGITPGTFVFTTAPELAPKPMALGDLVFTDGINTVTVPSCQITEVTSSQSDDGISVTVRGKDRRWMWESMGGVSGRYNQMDERGKLVPWTIRSPQELIQLCLEALGESNVQVSVPNGLPRSAGADITRYLRAGENFPETVSNPPIVWDYTPPGIALSQVVEYYGCHIIYSPVTDRFIIAPVGTGKALPNLPYESRAPSLSRPVAPERVGVAGAHIRFQMRFMLEAVGREWDDSYVPINLLSYAPIAGAKPQISSITNIGRDFPGDPGTMLIVKLVFVDPATLTREEIQVIDTNPGHTMAQRFATIKAGLLAIPVVAKNFAVVQFDATHLRLTGGPGVNAFGLDCSKNIDASPPAFNAEQVQAFQLPTKSWASCPIPTFTSVQPTDRLSYMEAKALAQDSVWKCFRILPFDPTFWPQAKPLNVPFFGRIKRRQQIVLQDKKCELIVPIPRIPGAVNKGNPLGFQPGGPIPNQGVLPEFYNGRSRERGATVQGSVFRKCGGMQVLWQPAAPGAVANVEWEANTGPTDRVFVPFTIDAVEQMVVFSDHVYYFQPGAGGHGYYAIPNLILETGCLVQDPDTSQPVRWEETLSTGGIAPTEWQIKEEVAVSVLGNYDEASRLKGFQFLDLADARGRAGILLRGMAAKYRVTQGEIREYPGILPIQPDGYVQQVTYQVGEGATTVASGNTEHSVAIPTLPARRRAELLPPNRLAALANFAEKQIVDTWNK